VIGRNSAPTVMTARALACLALGHVDADRTPCRSSDAELIADLVEEVQRLRTLTGQHPEDARNRVTALAHALGTTRRRADEVLADLGESGWTIVRTGQ
jgi:hypothetical protein